MGKLQLFAINLSDNSSVYFAGSDIDVEGSVLLELKEQDYSRYFDHILRKSLYAYWASKGHTVDGRADNKSTASISNSGYTIMI